MSRSVARRAFQIRTVASAIIAPGSNPRIRHGAGVIKNHRSYHYICNFVALYIVFVFCDKKANLFTKQHYKIEPDLR
jgi:hypothetical protein